MDWECELFNQCTLSCLSLLNTFFSFRKPRGTKTPKTPSSIKGILKTDSSQVCLIRNPRVVVA